MTTENSIPALKVWDLLKPYAGGRVFNAGRVCAACEKRNWATRRIKGQVYSHLGADGKFFQCSGFKDPVYSCECGKKKRGWGGPPRGWTQVQGFSALCTACTKPKKKRAGKAATDAA